MINLNKKFYSLGRLKSGEMNKTELAYSRFLEGEKKAGRILWFRFEGIKFKLGDNCHYNPDFAVLTSNLQLEIHEVKGFWQEDARVKIKVAAEMYPIKFLAVKLNPKKLGGGWEYEEF